MDHVVGHVVRRGMEAHTAWQNNRAMDGEKPEINIPAWGAAILGGTVIAFIITTALVSCDVILTQGIC